MTYPIGHATVDHMLDANLSTGKNKSNHFRWFAISGVGIVLIGGLFFYFWANIGARQNKRLARRQQEILQQLNEQFKNEPTQTAAMRDQLIEMSSELTKSQERNKRNLEAISKNMGGYQGTQLTPVDSGDPVFEQQLKTVLTTIKTNPTQAVKGASDLISQYPNRWESYGVAGVVLRSENQLSEAKLAYQQALVLAPDNIKPQLSAAIQQIDIRSGALPQ